MESSSICKNSSRSVAGLVVQERAAAQQLVLEVGQPRPGRFLPLVVLAPHRQRDAVAGGDDDTGRQDLDIEAYRFALSQGEFFVMAVIRTVFRRQLRIELSVR